MSDQLTSYDVQLHQIAEVHTETFKLEAKNEADAKKQAEAIVKSKDITKDYRLVVIDTTPYVAEPEISSKETTTPEPSDEGR